MKDSHTTLAAVVLAAGKGTRMKSLRPKVLHELVGTPLVGHVIKLLKELAIKRIITVIGHGAEQVSEYISAFGCETVVQEEQLGTGHAVACAEELLKDFSGNVLIICGDTPLLKPSTLKEFLHRHIDSGNILSVLSSRFADPYGYGRIVRDDTNAFLGIVEEKDADQGIRQVREVNTGTYLVEARFLFRALKGLDNDNQQGEFYLTDIVAMAVDEGRDVDAYPICSEEEALGVNSREQLSEAESVLLSRIRSRLMASGVTFENANSVYVEPEVQIGADTVIEPCVVLRGETVIGTSARIGSFSVLENVQVSDGVVLPPCTIKARG